MYNLSIHPGQKRHILYDQVQDRFAVATDDGQRSDWITLAEARRLLEYGDLIDQAGQPGEVSACR